MKNVMFKDTPVPKPSKGAFDLSHEKKLSAQIGELIPFTWMECVPGDSFEKIRTEVLCKFNPLIAPVLHRVDVYTHFFFVPYRLLMHPVTDTYAGWKEFITGDPDGLYTNETLPYITISNANKAYFAESTLADYLGLPVIATGTTVTQTVDVNCFPFFAYHLIYDHYYRDEDLVDPITGPNASIGDVALIGGDRSAQIAQIAKTSLHHRAYEKDYFKGALATAYTGSSSDVEVYGDLVMDDNTTIPTHILHGVTHAGLPGSPTQIDSDANHHAEVGGTDAAIDVTQHTDTAIEIMELRRAWAITRWLEAERRGGTRYNEMILGVWGISPANAELDYPEYIGGGKQAVKITSIVAQNETLVPSTDAISQPQGYETGRGLSFGGGHYAKHRCKEHGLIMGILSVLPRTAYGGAQIEKFWRKEDREDFFVPQLQNIGDQAVLQSEVGYDATGSDKDDVYGYQPRWAEYKFKNSTVHGEFLSSLKYWHMAEVGDTSGAGPDLNQAYIECGHTEDQNDRIFSGDPTTEDMLYFQIFSDVLAYRPMQVFDVPR